MRPWMSEPELLLFEAAARGKTCAVEFGLGGSTVSLIESGIARIVAVESNPEWIRKVSKNETLAPHIASGRLVVQHGDIGPTREWGYPLDNSRREDWPNYWRRPWQEIDPEAVDLVFVDGRFRVACALQALLMGNSDLTIVIHDFWNREHYRVLLDYLACACRVETMGVFFPRSAIRLSALKSDIQKHAFEVD